MCHKVSESPFILQKGKGFVKHAFGPAKTYINWAFCVHEALGFFCFAKKSCEKRILGPELKITLR